MIAVCNGRIALQGFHRTAQKTHTGLWIPGQFDDSKDNRDTVNPYKDHDFFCVGFAPEVPEQMRMQDNDGNPIHIKLGDRVIVSRYFEPIKHVEAGYTFLLIHWQDCLGILRNPGDEIEIVKEEKE